LWDKTGTRSRTELWDVRSGRRLACFDGEGFFSPDGGGFLVLSDNGKIELWTLPLQRPVEYTIALWMLATLTGAVAAWWCHGLRKRVR
jgi:hypothetical protein